MKPDCWVCEECYFKSFAPDASHTIIDAGNGPCFGKLTPMYSRESLVNELNKRIQFLNTNKYWKEYESRFVRIDELESLKASLMEDE